MILVRNTLFFLKVVARKEGFADIPQKSHIQLSRVPDDLANQSFCRSEMIIAQLKSNCIVGECLIASDE